jgi:hypothetical protein
MKQVVGDAGRGDNCADLARALKKGKTIEEIARDLKVSLIRYGG